MKVCQIHTKYSLFYFKTFIFLLFLTALNGDATKSSVLYANLNHPELRTEYPVWADRFKQILKKWRGLTSEQKQPYLTKARENRSAIRMKKAQQVRNNSFKNNIFILDSSFRVIVFRKQLYVTRVDDHVQNNFIISIIISFNLYYLKKVII